tara:strand:- start:6469 stop:9159 length:2691 start_codon:yes stop_codon:yes gene_type:complete
MNNTKDIFLISIIFISFLKSDLASPEPFRVQQPNGEKITIKNRGNHLQGWREHNGWTVTKNSEGWWVYALGNNGRHLIPSNIKVGIDQEPDTQISSIQRGIRPEPMILVDDAPIPDIKNTRIDTFHVPMILVEFPDANATYSPEQFDLIMNQEGYTHLNYENTGSFRDFYQEISYGQFLPIAEVSEWFTAPYEHDHYSYNNGYAVVRQLVRAMVDSLEASGFDWSGYDNDGDGYVDALNLVHQGPGAEEGDYSNIWSHKSSLGNLAVTYDGVTINSYNMNPETQLGTICSIGVLAHEFGHALGLPDLYDTDYSSSGSGKLALMASGTWGTSGTSPWYPATMVGWCKNELGWVDIVEILDDQDGVSIEQTYSSNTIFRVNHSQVEEEYWLIENRQNIGSDTLMPSNGLTIWHINDDIAQSGSWAPNNNEPYYGVGLEQADGMFALENGGPSDGNDVFPGNTDNREFSHSSSPNTTSLYGEPSMLRIDNISDPGEFMTFDVQYNEIILATASIEDGSGSAYNQGSISLGLDNEMALEEFEFELDFNPSFVEITGVTPTERTSYDSVIIENSTVTLINPTISPGTGTILNLQLFNNVGIEVDVLVSYDLCLGYTSDGSEVGITIQDVADYHIQAVEQFYNIQNGTGAVGGGASYIASLVNTVPIALTVFQLSNDPEILIPSAEPYEDLNENGEYDDGEPYTDWNQNGQWSPVVEPISLSEDWEIDVTVSGTNVTVAISNWAEPLEPAPHELFRVNCSVSDEAELNDVTTVNTNVLLVLDAWGNSGVPFVNGDGNVTIDEILSNDQSEDQPTVYSLNRVYPNPFNPITTIEFSVPKNNNDKVSLRVFDIGGRMVETLTNKKYASGVYKLNWGASKLSSGIYFLEFKVGSLRDIRKLSLLK